MLTGIRLALAVSLDHNGNNWFPSHPTNISFHYDDGSWNNVLENVGRFCHSICTECIERQMDQIGLYSPQPTVRTYQVDNIPDLLRLSNILLIIHGDISQMTYDQLQTCPLGAHVRVMCDIYKTVKRHDDPGNGDINIVGLDPGLGTQQILNIALQSVTSYFLRRTISARNIQRRRRGLLKTRIHVAVGVVLLRKINMLQRPYAIIHDLI